MKDEVEETSEVTPGNLTRDQGAMDEFLLESDP